MCFDAIFREVGSALVTQMENSEWRQNLRAEVAEKERNIMEKKGVIKNPGTRIEMQIQRIQHKGVTVYVYNMVSYAWRIPLFKDKHETSKLKKIHGLLVLLRLSDHLLPFLLDSFYSPGFSLLPHSLPGISQQDLNEAAVNMGIQPTNFGQG